LALFELLFIDRFVGGGVLGNGCLQEEIKFATCPELIAARLITERLEDNEALLVQGARPYSTSTGYADSFKYTGEADINAKCSDTLLAIDATNYRYDYRMQYTKENIDREILKAYAGFSECPLQKIATGNWGGGAFMVFKFSFILPGRAESRSLFDFKKLTRPWFFLTRRNTKYKILQI